MFNSVTKSKSLMNNPSRRKLIIITLFFLIAGFWGIFLGLIVFTKPNFIVTALGMVNISLGIFLGFKVLRMNDKQHIKRKK
jgi:1,4-dihydroxy-2-naphthoate octaprenyltransferase